MIIINKIKKLKNKIKIIIILIKKKKQYKKYHPPTP